MAHPTQDPGSPPDSDERLAHLLKARYGMENQPSSAVWLQVGQLLNQEMGMGPYKTRLKPKQRELPQVDLMGVYTPVDNRIRLASDLDGNQTLSTLAHEMGHAADSAMAGDEPQHQKGYTHHRYYKNFEPEFAAGIEEQNLRQAGLPLDPQMAGQYPWLKKVQPNASNPLATPWHPGAKTTSPWIWNMADLDSRGDY